MKKFSYSLFALYLLTASAASADEPVETVRVLIDMAIHNSSDPADGKFVQEDYFSANVLLRYFSEDFTKAFATALLKSNERRHEMMIDWDPIIGGQDSCPLKSISYSPPTNKKGKIEIVVGFKAKACFDDDSGKADVTKVTFTLVKENLDGGAPVYLIDDISHPGEDSLKTTLREIVK
ncbi:hypothetical protein LJR030_003181 [Rhizobium sp. LjRoot30]|uniref:hypothetical protein n=1 Tax=Rhizobium sp. LjRoot30 TaxID=3342320 RepID=UPI003ED045EF